MKVISGNQVNPEGIDVLCECCHCEYRIEDRNDWDQEQVFYDSNPYGFITTNHKVMNYITHCPVCGYEFFLGVNPRESSNDNIAPRYSWIFDRPDWNERYSMEAVINKNV